MPLLPQERLKRLQGTDAISEMSKLQRENQHLAGLVLQREATVAELQEQIETLNNQIEAANTHKSILLPVSHAAPEPGARSLPTRSPAPKPGRQARCRLQQSS